MSPASQPTGKPALLCISQAFSPATTPTAIHASKLLGRLAEQWDITVVTEASGGHDLDCLHVEVVPSRRPATLFRALRRMRLQKLIELFVWPDESIFWLIPAILAGRRIVRHSKPDAIVVFMMPYSSGLVGVLLSRISGIPLILDFDDSLTCTDMHPQFPTRVHYRMARGLEDYYARRADAIIYVSGTNLDSVRARQPAHVQKRFHLVRYGAEPVSPPVGLTRAEHLEIAYVGAMSGWWALIDQRVPASPPRRLFRALMRLGRHERQALDERTSSPAILGGAIIDAVGEDAGWTGRIRLTIHGNPYPQSLVARALSICGIDDVVTVNGPVPHDEVAEILARADLLFLTLPARSDGSRGGRISAKTYEYLATDRPILAAVPRGENWDYLSDVPGVWLVAPDDRQAMGRVLARLARAKFAGEPLAFDRAHLRDEISYVARAGEFAAAIRAAIDHRATRRPTRRGRGSAPRGAGRAA